MASAESKVQQMRYASTFPLLLNIADQPSYFMALKGNDGLVKMYAMVNVQQYQIVETGATVAECEQNYRTALLRNGLISASSTLPDSLAEEDAEVLELRSAVIGGETVLYIRTETGWYSIAAADAQEAVLLSPGDRIRIRYAPQDGQRITPILSLVWTES